MSRLLLAEELAVIAMRPRNGRSPLGTRYALNACLSGLLLAELRLPDRPRESSTLQAAARVLEERGPKLRPTLSAMDRSLRRWTGQGTWDTVTAGLVHTDRDALRGEIVNRLRRAATSTEPVDVRTALLLSFVGPAKLLRLVAPRWRQRWSIRGRVDHLLDGTPFVDIRAEVVRAIAAQEAAVGAAGVSTSMAAGAG